MTITPKNRAELLEIIAKRIKEHGNKCNLNDIDVSKVTDMSFLFAQSKFNGNISKWDVRNVTNMNGMFKGSSFDGDISKWRILSDCTIKNFYAQAQLSYDHMPERHKVLYAI